MRLMKAELEVASEGVWKGENWGKKTILYSHRGARRLSPSKIAKLLVGPHWL